MENTMKQFEKIIELQLKRVEAMKKEGLTKEDLESLLMYYYVQAWDGKLPETFVGEDGNVMSILDLAALLQQQQQETTQPTE